MQKDLLRKASDYLARNRRHRKWKKAVSVLACVVVFCTTYMLILPAITMETTTYCGYEMHQHSQECYEKVLICSQEETRTAVPAYNEDGTVCEQGSVSENEDSENRQTEECYEEEETGIYGPEEEETTGHIHTDACYESILTCGIEEHIHDAGCYTKPEADAQSDTEEQGQSVEYAGNEDETVPGYAAMSENSGEGGAPDNSEESTAESSEEKSGDRITQTCEGEDYTITVTYGPEAEIPGNAKLNVSEYAHDDEIYLQRYDEAVKFYEWGEEIDEEFRLFDISLFSDGEEIEPAAPLQVTLTFFGQEDDSAYTVTHFRNVKGMDDTPSLMSLDLEESRGDDTAAFDAKESQESDDGEIEAVEAVSTYDYENDTQSMTFTLESLSDLGTSAANPQYTIQHYLKFGQVVVSDTNTDTGYSTWLPFINTSSNRTAGTIYDSVNSVDWSLSSANLVNGATESTLKIFYAALDSEGSLATTEKYVPLFQDEDALYKAKPQIQYMSRMYNDETTYNKNYKLDAVWVYQPDVDGKLPDDLTDETDGWVKYKITTSESGERDYSTQIHFTNNPWNEKLTDTNNTDSAGYVQADKTTETYPHKYTVLIQKNTVVRLVYTATEDEYKSEVNFFDYDITDGSVYSTASDAYTQTNAMASSTANNSPTGYYVNTINQGINSISNYSGEGAKYAFGNANAGFTLGGETWSNNNRSNYLNQSNSATYSGIAFGLVSGLTTGSQGLPRLIFSDGIQAPNLFGADDSDDGVAGKTSYVNGEYTLGFARVGGTYTLSSVMKNADGNLASSGLTQFKTTYTRPNGSTIKSNEFWPLTGAASHGADGHDTLFGSYAKYTGTDTVGQIKYVTSNTGSSAMPIADIANQAADPTAYNYNSYFGMSYSVNFTLKPGYCAPLTYWFYGDDDMWVFLEEVDGDGSGKNAKLIADIGGVHSSVGEYVNLWNYIDPIEYTNADGSPNSNKTYRLTIFYTERGASGSSCYMRFVLPMDEQELANESADEVIVIEKELKDQGGNVVAYDNSSEEFEFLLKIRDDKEQPTYDMYDYAIYHRNTDGTSTQDSTGTIASSSAGNIFKLKGGQYIVISGLYTDRFFIVSEQGDNAAKYMTSTQYGKYDADTGQITNLTEAPTYDLSTEDDYDLTSTSDYNYILFTNAPSQKIEVSPGNKEGVTVGEEITYEVQWANDTSEGGASITVTDELDAGVDFVAADFRATAYITDSWQLTSETESYDGSGTDSDSVTYGTITYDSAAHTVTWTLTSDARAYGVVSLKVKVNKTGLELTETEKEDGVTVATIDNQAKVTVNDSTLITNIVTNPVWDPVKSELTPGAGETVAYGQTITYKVAWKNYLLESAEVTVRDPLDKGVTYDAATCYAKAFYSDGTEVPGAMINHDQLTDGNTGERYGQLTWMLGEQSSGAEGYVEFTVTVNETGVRQDEILNWAFVKVGNNSEVQTNTIVNDTPRVTLTIQKVDQSGYKLTGAEFQLYYTETKTDAETGEAVDTTDYYYHYNESTVSWTEDTDYVITDHSMTVFQLVPGMIYYLVETKAPDGYELLNAPVAITVASDGTVTVMYGSDAGTGWTVTQSDTDDYVWTINVPNSSGYELPETGGTGIYLFTLSGLLLIAGAVGCGYGLRRRRERRGR